MIYSINELNSLRDIIYIHISGCMSLDKEIRQRNLEIMVRTK